MFSANLQIHIVTSCIHLRIQHTSRIPYLFHIFSDFVVYAAMTLFFSEKSVARCQFFDKCLSCLWFKRTTTVPNELIDSQHYKRLGRETLMAFHSLSHFTLTTTRLNLLFLKNLKLLENNSETGTIFLQPPVISFKRDKNIGNFSVRSSFYFHFTCTSAYVSYRITYTY